MSHNGLNPASVTRDSNGVIWVIDEYSGKAYTAEQYKEYAYNQTHKPSVFKRACYSISGFFSKFHFFKNHYWDSEDVGKIILGLIIPIFLILGVLDIRNQAPIGVIVFHFLIAGLAIAHIPIIDETMEGIPSLIGFVIQIAIVHFIIFGSLFSLEFFWRLIIGIILMITCFVITYKISDEL